MIKFKELLKLLAVIGTSCFKTIKDVVWFGVAVVILNSYTTQPIKFPYVFWFLTSICLYMYHYYVCTFNVED